MKSVQARAAAMIRKTLKAHGIKASVKSRTASMMTAVDVTLFDPTPSTTKKVVEFTQQFQYGQFDGMTDSYNVTNNRDDLPQVKFVHVRASFSDAMRAAAAEFVRNNVPDSDTLNTDDTNDAVRHTLHNRGPFWTWVKPRVIRTAEAAA